MENENKSNKGPEHKIRVGAITATIWKNEVTNQQGSFETYSVVLERNYTDNTNTWKTTNQYKQQDIPKAVLALQKAYEWLSLKEEGK